MQVRKPRPQNSASGFTLVELGVVLMIVGLMTFTVGASFDSLVPGERLNTSVRKLASVLREARSEAFTRNAEFMIEYDLDQNNYRLVTPFLNGGGLFLPGIHHEDERYLSEWNSLRTGVEFGSLVLAGEVFDSGRVLARFDPSGSASDHWVVLTQPKYNSIFTVEVLALTGMIRFHEGNYSRPIPEDSEFD